MSLGRVSCFTCCYAEWRYAEYRYAECLYAECRGAMWKEEKKIILFLLSKNFVKFGLNS